MACADVLAARTRRNRVRISAEQEEGLERAERAADLRAHVRGLRCPVLVVWRGSSGCRP